MNNHKNKVHLTYKTLIEQARSSGDGFLPGGNQPVQFMLPHGVNPANSQIIAKMKDRTSKKDYDGPIMSPYTGL
jgi:hypothetical protein